VCVRVLRRPGERRGDRGPDRRSGGRGDERPGPRLPLNEAGLGGVPVGKARDLIEAMQQNMPRVSDGDLNRRAGAPVVLKGVVGCVQQKRMSLEQALQDPGFKNHISDLMR
jgi:hypothetical protein